MRCVYQITPYLISAWGTCKAWQAAVCLTCQLQASWEGFFSNLKRHISIQKLSKVDSKSQVQASVHKPDQWTIKQDGRGWNRAMGAALTAFRAWPRAPLGRHDRRTKNIRVHREARCVMKSPGGHYRRLSIRRTFSTEAPITVQVSSSMRPTFSRKPSWPPQLTLISPLWPLFSTSLF